MGQTRLVGNFDSLDELPEGFHRASPRECDDDDVRVDETTRMETDWMCPAFCMQCLIGQCRTTRNQIKFAQSVSEIRATRRQEDARVTLSTSSVTKT